MRKIVILAALALLFIDRASAQQCGSLSTNFANDLCWFKNFVRPQLGVSDAEIFNYQTYSYGKNSYTLKNDKAPWGGNYFSWKSGGLATRWAAYINEPSFPNSTQLDYSNVANMTTAQLARLSPAEKLDIYLGYKDFRITKQELKNRGPETSEIESWEGFCNGVRAAGALTPEPIKNVTVTSPDGKQIIFYPVDLKILIGASYFYLGDFGYGQFGSNHSVAPNAGVFDIALRLLIGDKEKVFFFDNNQSEQIWNHSVIGYERAITENMRAARSGEVFPNNATKLISYKLTLYHMGETSPEDMNSPTKPRISNLSPCCVEREIYNYTLYLNNNNKIVDGKWKNNLYPDAVWFAAGKGDDQNHTASRGIDPNTGKPYKGDGNLDHDKILQLVKMASN
ncbi:MAG: hypothetical protein J7502_17080 [Flavisolibacter sp.]|nr:hypothetical protein [Flavisolibacter sp.]